MASMVSGRWVPWPFVTPREEPVSSPVTLPPVAEHLGAAFARAGHELHLVGGPVRDALLGRPCAGLDFATDARPERVLEIVGPLTGATWTTGIEFGTIGARV